MPDRKLHIPVSMRLAFAGKGLLLWGLAAVFAGLAKQGWGVGAGWMTAVAILVLTPLALFLAWAGALAFIDVVARESICSSGAVALASRRSGHSLRLPDGHFVEFILFNPWRPLTPGRRYTVTYGRFSRVLVAPPEPEASDDAPTEK